MCVRESPIWRRHVGDDAAYAGKRPVGVRLICEFASSSLNLSAWRCSSCEANNIVSNQRAYVVAYPLLLLLLLLRYLEHFCGLTASESLERPVWVAGERRRAGGELASA